MFKKQFTDVQFLVVTMLVVLALGAKTFASLTEPDELQLPSVATNDAGLGVSRTPSSVGPAKEAKPRWDRFAHHDLNCHKKIEKPVVAINGNFVQLQGKHCLKGFKFSELDIVNRQNGFAASIFESGSDQYQTDLIQLEQGDNEIVIRYRENSGALVEEVVKVRSNRI